MGLLKKIVLFACLITGICGFIMQLEVFWLNQGMYFMGYCNYFTPDIIAGFDNKYHLISINHNGSVNLFNLIIFSLFIVGSFLQIINQSSKIGIKLFRFSLNIILLSNLLMLCFGKFFIWFSYSSISCFIWIVICLALNKLFVTDLDTKIEDKQISKSTRLIHFIGDSLIFYFLSYYYTIEDFSWVSHIINFTFLYIISELVFSQTPLKVLTGSIVISQNNKLKSILIRNLTRLIPFEGFTIFSEKGILHDRLSKTKVVKI